MLGATVRVIENKLPRLERRLPFAVREIVAVTTLEAQRVMKESMREGKSGRMYRRGKRTHQASADGEAPAIDYGHLINSLMVTFEHGGMSGVVYTNSDYAAPLEFGTRKMAPRPFMDPAAEAVSKGFYEAMANLERSLR